MKAKEIIAEWLGSKKGKTIAYHDLEQVKEYGKLFFNANYNQGTYDREFRKLKQDTRELANCGVKLETDTSMRQKETYWKVLPL